MKTTSRIPWRKKFKRSLLALGALLILYVGSCICLSAAGEYRFSQTGKRRYTFGLSMTDVIHWYPKWLYWEPFRNVYDVDTIRGNFLGYVYSPLIRIDRAWFHPSNHFFDNLPPASATAPAGTQGQSSKTD